MSGLIAEVRGFLDSLRGELPELFVPPSLPPRRRTAVDAEGFSVRAAHFAPLMGVSYGRVRAKTMTSLWGSCSARGDLSFNARLLAAPPEVLDYVVVHELAHRVHRGHGATFWTLVERHCREHRTQRRWLRKNGALLLGDPEE